MEKIKILIVEDNENDLELILRELRKNNISFDYIHVNEFAEFVKTMTENAPDLIFSDYNLNSFDGIEVLKYRNEHAPLIPFIKITGSIGEERAVEIIKTGADDYILKENLSRLTPAVLNSIRKMRLHREKDYAERRLKESEEKFSKMFHFSPIPICIVDFQTGLIMDLNESFSNFTEYAQNELVGSYIFDFEFIKKDYFQSEIKPALSESHAVKNIELNIKTKSGKHKCILCNLMNVTLSEVKYTIIKFVDITDRKIMEEELSIAKEKAEEMNRLKSNLLANLSHEFRTPLNGILGFSEMLENEITDEDQKSFVEAIRKSGYRLLQTLNDLMDLSIVDAEKTNITKKSFDIGFVTKMIFENAKNISDKKLAFIFEQKSENLFCNSDEGMYVKILNKLIDNAVKFTSKGFIKVSLEKVEVEGKNYIQLNVIDTGIGISLEDMEVIFERFRQLSEGVRRDYEGVGIGLTIAKRIVERLGGTIKVFSKIGVGSEFSVLLPAFDDIVIHIPKELSEVETEKSFLKIMQSREVKVLLVEDNEVDCLYMNKLIGEYCSLTVVSDSHKAEKFYNIIKYDLIILDIQFTTGVNGVELLKEIKLSELNKNTPVIASTAMALSGDKEMLIWEGFDDYIKKPFNKNQLHKAIMRHLK